MKIRKALVFLLVLCLLSSTFFACGRDTTNGDQEQSNNCEHSWENATCDKPRTCSLCSATVGLALGHSWKKATCETPEICSRCNKVSEDAYFQVGHLISNGKCTVCGKIIGTWEIGDFVDEFDQPIGKKFISTQVTGTFSNSETSSSKLIAILQVTEEDVAIMLWEYGTFSVTCSNVWDKYDITMKDGDGKQYHLSGSIYFDSSRIYFDESDENTVINALKKPGLVSFYLALSDKTTTNYSFVVECSNFNVLYPQIKAGS